jgi:hypothetical protein
MTRSFGQYQVANREPQGINSCDQHMTDHFTLQVGLCGLLGHGVVSIGLDIESCTCLHSSASSGTVGPQELLERLVACSFHQLGH